MDDVAKRRRLANVPTDLVEAEPRVVTARHEVETLDREHTEAMKAHEPLLKARERAAADKAKAEVALTALRHERLAVAGRILLGEATESDEEEMLARIAKCERVIERINLGLPAVEERGRQVSQGVGAVVRRIEGAAHRLESVRATVREELAIAASA